MGRGSRNNALAGGLLLAAIVASVIAVSLLGGLLEMVGKTSRTVRFAITEGVTGLKKGSEVRMGGLKIGSVDSVRPILENGSVSTIEVKIKISEKEAPLHQGAVAFLETALLGSASNLNFINLGDPAAPALTEADIIPGRLAPPGFLAAAGYGDEQKQKVQTIIDRAESFITKADDFAAKANTEADVFKQKREVWYSDFDVMTRSGKKLMEQDVPEITEKIKAGATDAGEFLAKAKKVINENEASINEFIAHARQTSIDAEAFGKKINDGADWFKGTVEPLVEDLLSKGRDKAVAALDKVNSLLGEQTPVVRTALAKLRLSADQLAATLAEVRRSPWRLIYRPDKRDLEFELLYDSARAYAQAVSDLSSSAEALKGLSDGGSLKAGDKSVQELLNNLDASFRKYEQAESEFLRQVQAKSK